MPTFSDLKSDYENLWARMAIRSDRAEAVTAIARKLIAKKGHYAPVAARTGVPWFVIAALHERESGADFATYLGNGEPLGRRTRLVPKGRGPFGSWEEGAIDALALDGLDQVADWTPARACYEIEKFNGFGYRGKGIRSPYLWSFSNHYARGKYVADGRFSATAVDAQCGAMPVLKRIMELDATATFKKSRTVEAGAGGGIIVGGGVATKQAIEAGASLETIIAIIVVTGAVAVGALLAIRWWRNRHAA